MTGEAALCLQTEPSGEAVVWAKGFQSQAKPLANLSPTISQSRPLCQNNVKRRGEGLFLNSTRCTSPPNLGKVVTGLVLTSRLMCENFISPPSFSHGNEVTGKDFLPSEQFTHPNSLTLPTPSFCR